MESVIVLFIHSEKKVRHNSKATPFAKCLSFETNWKSLVVAVCSQPAFCLCDTNTINYFSGAFTNSSDKSQNPQNTVFKIMFTVNCEPDLLLFGCSNIRNITLLTNILLHSEKNIKYNFWCF